MTLTVPKSKKSAPSKRRSAKGVRPSTQPDTAGIAVEDSEADSCSATPNAATPMNMSKGESARKARISDGPEWVSWSSMKTRCTNPNRRSYKWYGGRVIKVCERWQSFSNFLADMGPRPDGHSLDRINPNGNYEPENCMWSPQSVQMQHNTRTKLTDYMVLEARVRCERGEGIKAVAREFGVLETTLGMAVRGQTW